MQTKILVTYATTHGSTQEIANFITAEIKSRQLDLDILPVKEVTSLEGYNLVFLGAPLYMFKLHADAKKFLKRFESEIQKGLPVAVYAGGPFGEATADDWEKIEESLDKELAKVSWFKPLKKLVVGGKFDPTKLRFPYSLIPAMKQMPASDLRDWQVIKEWVTEVLRVYQVEG